MKPIYTFGPIIHNEKVARDLEEKGVPVLHTEGELLNLQGDTVVICSHGAGKHTYELLEGGRIYVVDAIYPFVKEIHRTVEKQNRGGRHVIIIGDGNYLEVQRTKGWRDDGALVAKTEEQLNKLPVSKDDKLCIVSQMTFNYNKFQDLVEKFSKKGYDILVLNAICDATQERQMEVRRIASQVGVMIVIGGKSSSSTQELYEMCRKERKSTYYIQTLGDSNPENVDSVRGAGITAGASTPNYIIEGVHTNVRAES